jgi:hypothetical protein
VDIDATFLCQRVIPPLMSRFRNGIGFVVVTVVAMTFVVVTAFETNKLPVTFRVVAPVLPVSVDVFANTFVVVTAFETNKLPVTLIVLVAFDMVSVFAKRLVVVTAFET